ncbi:serine/threonine-protein kinase [Mesoterricola silvestris]|uniref:Protein kinase domain-containing protein n=1 Tax=Mesoterricola silvestris TaxID=2927979 RepID=A0AA48GV80_9BACT|nr:serine/threonine-protein kinase [Mesoterricola silvestris]BDU74672.1 hypothetical protein METEAL_38460 [Mesoterricola silvestris]
MFSANLSSRILKEAHSRGLLGDPRPADDSSAQDPEGDFWGEELATLLASGRMSRVALNSLAWEAIGGEAGSWIDPLFKGPAPIGELKGLGDRYQDLVPIGEGASALVYKGLDTLLQRHVAIKALKDPRGPILEEARAQAKVEHPNVCRVYEVGQGHLVMQLVEGPTLAQLLPSLDLGEKVRIIRDIALGIHAAHQKDLIHLDLKLGNVLMERHEDGIFHPIISDFGMVAGASKASSGGCSLGTPPYTSPEQLARDTARIGPGTDVYALGVMLYVMVAGASPFRAHDFEGLLEAMAKDPPVPLRQRVPAIARDLAAIVAKCMEKDPGQRYASAWELAEDLDRFQRAEPVAAMGRAPAYRLAKWYQRNRMLQWVSGLGLLALAASLALFVRHSTFLTQQAEWDHHCQKIVGDLGAHLDRTYRLPPHDIRPELKEAEAFVGKILEARRGGGAAARGPACLALGQAYFLMDAEDARAVASFQEAWDSGYRTESARSWLAITLLATFRKDQWSFMSGLQDPANRGKVDEIRRQYLDPARKLLRGRKGSDQVKLAFLVDLADAKMLDAVNLDWLLNLTRTYRAQFPQDLDGLFEEAMALSAKAGLLIVNAGMASGAFSSPEAQEAASYQQRARALLVEALRLAPSLPRAYGALAEENLKEDSLPTKDSRAPVVLFEEARALLDQGLKVRGRDPVLTAQYGQLLATHVLPYRLARGMDPEPVARDLAGLRPDPALDPSGRSLRALLEAKASFLKKCNYYGVKPPPAFVEACRRCLQEPWTGSEAARFEWCSTAAQTLAETGEDPVGIIQGIHATFHPAGPPEWTSLGRLDLLAAERVWLAYGDPLPWLSRAQDCLDRLPVPSVFRTYLAQNLLSQRIRLVGDGPSWAEFRTELGRIGKGDPAMASGGLDRVLEMNVLLARRALAEKQDAEPYLREIGRCLQAPLVKNYAWMPYYKEQMATLLLLQSGPSGSSLPEALQWIDKAYAQVLPPRVSGPGRAVPSMQRFLPESSADLARIRSLKAEILAAMAARETRPAARIRLAREAVALLQQSLQVDRLQERRLRPILDQALPLTRN